jgi:hypothetical protein
MRVLCISMAIGVVAGMIDIIPMWIKRLERKAVLSAFLQYFFLSIVIVNMHLPGIVWWLQGSIVALCLTLPVLIIVSDADRKSVPIIAVNSVVLGALIGLAGHLIK